MNTNNKNPLQLLKDEGWEIESYGGAEEIIQEDFVNKISEIVNILLSFKISIQEIMCEGGGLHPINKRIRHLFAEILEKEVKFQTQRVTFIPTKKKGKEKVDKRIISYVDEEESHSVDFFHEGKIGNFGLETEWNSKVLAYERDINTFKNLFTHSAISVGIIITRGDSLDNKLLPMCENFFKSRVKQRDWMHDVQLIKEELSRFIDHNDNPLKFKNFTERQIGMIDEEIEKGEEPYRAVAKNYVAEKWRGQTTEIEAGSTRINRGGFRGIPILLIGFPDTIVE